MFCGIGSYATSYDPVSAFCPYLDISAGEGNGTPLQYSCLENPMDWGGWWAAVHGVAKSQTQLSDFTFPFHFHALEKEMATHSSVLAWRIPEMGEPGGLPSMGSHRVGHDWSDLAAEISAHISSPLVWIHVSWLLVFQLEEQSPSLCPLADGALGLPLGCYSSLNSRNVAGFRSVDGDFLP